MLLIKLDLKKSYAIPADLGKESECKRVVEEITKRENRIDILINNAGNNWGEALETFPEHAWDKVMSLNVKSIFFLTRYMIPLLEAGANKSGTNSRVINIGSIDGIKISGLETYAYSSSKAAVHHLTRVLTSKLASYKINVNAIAPGAFESKMMAETLNKYREAIESSAPLGRIGNPCDIVGVCIYLSSKASEWVTGSILVVDGGVTSKSSLM